MSLGVCIHGWKEIATHIGRTERTARRWEAERDLPVRRTPGKARASVYAVVAELDAWLLSAPQPDSESSPAAEAEFEASSVAKISLRESIAPHLWGTRTLLRGAIAAAMLVMVSASVYGLRSARHPMMTAQSGAASSFAEVNELYLSGVQSYEKRTPESLVLARRSLVQAVEKDPGFARGWAALANTYVVLGEYNALSGANEYALARNADEHALALDRSLGEPHANLGFIDFFKLGAPEQAEAEFRQALALEPNSAMVHCWFGTTLIYEKRYTEALAQFDRAVQLDPHSDAVRAGRALALGLGGQRDQGLAILVKLNKDAPTPMIAHHLALLAQMQPTQMGLYLQAEEEIYTLGNLDANTADIFRQAARVYALHSNDEKAAWRWIAANPGTDSLLKAEANAAIGEDDAAVAILNDLVRWPAQRLAVERDFYLHAVYEYPVWTQVLGGEVRNASIN